MQRSQGSVLSVDQALFDDSKVMAAISPGLCYDEWLGRLWLPANDRVEPTRGFCLIRPDGHAGEMVTDCFALSITP